MGIFACAARPVSFMYCFGGLRNCARVFYAVTGHLFSFGHMKAIKIYIAVASLLLVIAIGLGIYVWYTVQKVQLRTDSVFVPPRVDQVKDVVPETTESPSVSPDPTPVVKKPVVIQTSNLPESQQKILGALGLTAGTITITPAMVQCAGEAVGETRLYEIVKGSAPSVPESMKLLPCFKP